VRWSAGCKTHEIDEQWQVFSALARGNIDVDFADSRIAERVAVKYPALQRQPVNGPSRSIRVFAHRSNWLLWPVSLVGCAEYEEKGGLSRRSFSLRKRSKG
jgi:hypothetical protein